MHSNIFSDIAEGLQSGENPLDVYIICLISSSIDFQRRDFGQEWTIGRYGSIADTPQGYGSEFRSTLKMYAKIWCQFLI